MPNDNVDGGVPAPEPGGLASTAPPAPAPAPAAQKPKPAGWRATLSNLSSLIKDFGIVAAIVATPIAIVVVVIWEGVLRPRLASEIMTELSRPDDGYRAWHRDNVIGALSGFDEDTWKKWRDADDKQVIERLARPPEAEEIKALFADPDFRKFFQRQVLLSVSGLNDDYVDGLFTEYGETNMLKAWLSPVTDQVDAVYTLNLFYQKTPVQGDDGRQAVNEAGVPLYDTTFKISDQFYATDDQLFHINVRPETKGGFYDIFRQEAAVLTITIGNFTQNINVNGYQDDVTCIVRTALNNAPSGFVTVRANIKRSGPLDPNNPVTLDGQVPDGGFDMKIIVTAKKGRKTC